MTDTASPLHASEQRLYEKNLDFFEEKYPDIHRDFALVAKTDTIRIVSNDDKTNLWVGSVPYYTNSFEETFDYQQQQHQKFAHHFVRKENLELYSENIAFTSPISGKCRSEISQLIKKHQLKAGTTNTSVGALLVLGLGTGQHLLTLAEKYEPRLLIVHEENIHLIQATLSFLDWSELSDKLQEIGCTIRVDYARFSIAEHDFNFFIATLKPFERHMFYHLTVFIHRVSHFYSSFFHNLRLKLSSIQNVTGFVEDEVVMTSNIISNLSKPDCEILTKSTRHKKNCPALIIASGPSIDGNYKQIAELSRHMVVISCGTAIAGLLRNGITPDFHCELENGKQLPLHFEELQKLHNLDDVQLFASYSVDPRLQRYFKKKLLFYRPGPRIGSFFSGQIELFINCEPSVLNVGVALAANFGFEEAYLFGGDLGSRSVDQHHGKDIMFYNNKRIADELSQQFQVNKDNITFGIETNANFGGVCYTNSVLELFFTYVVNALKSTTGFTLYNCSDGRLIEGAIPCLPESIPNNVIDPIKKEQDIRAIHTSTCSASTFTESVKAHTSKLLTANKRIEKKLLRVIRTQTKSTSDTLSSDSLNEMIALSIALNEAYQKKTKRNVKPHSNDWYDEIINEIVEPSFTEILSLFVLLFVNYDTSHSKGLMNDVRHSLTELCRELSTTVNKISDVVAKP